MKEKLLELLAAAAHAELMRLLIAFILLNETGDERLLTFKLDCPCGRCHFVALSSCRPSILGVGRTAEEAKRKLFQKLAQDEIPDYLPEDF